MVDAAPPVSKCALLPQTAAAAAHRHRLTVAAAESSVKQEILGTVPYCRTVPTCLDFTSLIVDLIHQYAAQVSAAGGPSRLDRKSDWAVELGRWAGDRDHGRLQRDHLPVPAVISGFAKREVTRSRFRTRSQPASLLQPVIYLFLNFNI